MIDLHNHSEFSIDSRTPMEENILVAINNGLKYISITDHMEIVEVTDVYSDTLDVEGYFNKYKKLKETYKDDITVLSGVEVGIQECTAKIVDDFVSKFDYDFVIGSVHSLFEKDLYHGGYYKNLTTDELYKTYYEEMYRAVKATRNFDVLGHIDYIDRYLDKGVKVPNQEDNKETILKIFKELIDSNRGIEINTGGYRRGLPYLHPHEKILKWYKEAGGEIITIGSDAHISKDVGANSKDAVDYLKANGFTGVYIFENRKPRKLKF